MLPKQSDLEVPLLRCLEQVGGKGRPSELSPLILKHFPNVTEEDLNQKLSTGANKWKNTIAWARQKLITIGEIVSPTRGVWAITEAGRQRLARPTPLQLRRKHFSLGTISESVDALLPTVSRPVKFELRSRSKPTDVPDQDFENKVWRLIHGLAPKSITVGNDPEIKLKTGNIFRPDALAIFGESRALLVECKLTNSEAFLASWFSRFRNEKRDLTDTFRENGWKLIPLLVVEDRHTLKSHIVQQATELRVKVIGQREIDYFQALKTSCGIGVSHLFWAQVAPWVVSQEELSLPALRIKQGKSRDAFIFSANAHDLLARSIVSHRELHSPEEGTVGFQRMLNKKKLREIEKHIRKYKTFPTPIIIAFRKPVSPVFDPLPKGVKSVESMRGEIEFGFIRISKNPDGLQVIDGQHRLYGYSGLERSDDHVVHVVGYKTVKDPTPADLFVDINSKQTKVPSKLLWELYPDIYGEDDPDFYEAVISRVTESAAKNHLRGFFEHISSGMKGDISFNTLCSELKRAQLFAPEGLTQNEDLFANIVEAFFGALVHLGDLHPGVNQGFVLSNTGITPMIRTMSRIVRYEVGRNKAPILSKRNALRDTFESYFEPVYKFYGQMGETALRALRKKRIGGAGANLNEDEITEKIRFGYDPQFPFRPKKQICPPEWEAAINNSASAISAINHEVTDRGISSGWVFQEFDAEKFKQKLRKAVNNEDSFESVVKALYQVVIESTGKTGTENRLAKLLNLSSLYEKSIISDLNTLRTCIQHFRTQVDVSKRQKAVIVLGQLAGRSITGWDDLQPEDFQTMAKVLLSRIHNETLTPALESMG